MDRGNPKRIIEKTFIIQHDSSDCGVACLRSVIRYYGGDFSFETLRELSGTNREGTTLLGLFEAAQKTGFEAAGSRIHSSELATITSPAILHVVIQEDQLHYVVWYGRTTQEADKTENKSLSALHLIGDPAKGVVEMSEQELMTIWQSKVCLTLTPNSDFVTARVRKRKKWEWFKTLIRDDIGLLSITAVLGLLVASAGLAMAIFSQKLIDSILPLKNHNKLFLGVLFVSFILLVRICLDALRAYILLKQSQLFNNRINERFQKVLLSLPKLFFDNRSSGDLVARMNDIARIQEVIGQLAGHVLVDLLIIVASCCVLFAYSWQAATMVLISLPLFGLLIYSAHSSISAKQNHVMLSYAGLETNYINTIQGIGVIKAFNRQSFFQELNQKVYGTYQQHIFDLGLVKLRLNGMASLAGLMIQMSILTYLGNKVFEDQLKVGELMAILALISTMLPSVGSLALLAIPINEAKIAFDRLFEFVDLSPEERYVTSTTENELDIDCLEFRNLSFKFPGRPRLLTEISFLANRGEIIGVVGTSGSGKSTILRLIERVYLPASGEIMINEHNNIADVPLSSWRKMVSSVPQEVHLFNGTVMDNILLGQQYDETALTTLFNHQCFVLFISSLPQGLNTLVGHMGVNISGGQKQWIGLMRALYKKTGLLLLDEVTAAMDSQSELLVLELLKELRSQMIIIYVSHRLHTLPQLCDRTHVIGNTGIIASGHHNELLRTENIYSKFWNAFASS